MFLLGEVFIFQAGYRDLTLSVQAVGPLRLESCARLPTGPSGKGNSINFAMKAWPNSALHHHHILFGMSTGAHL
jgi:hypothetical protein